MMIRKDELPEFNDDDIRSARALFEALEKQGAFGLWANVGEDSPVLAQRIRKAETRSF